MTDTPSIIIDRTEANPDGVKVLAWGDGRARTWPLVGKDLAEIEAKAHPGSEVWRPVHCSAWFLKLP